MTGEISALGCAFTWALSSVFTKSLAPKFHPLTLNLLRCLGASLVLWCLIPFYPGVQSLSQAPSASLFYLIVSALLGICLGDTIYIKGLTLINANLAFPLAQASMPILTLAAAVLFLGETMSWSLGLGTVLVIAGVSLIANPEGPETSSRLVPPHPKKGLGIGLILIASVFWTISISLLKPGLQGMNLILANGIRLPLAALVLALLSWKQRPAGRALKPGFREICLGAFSGALSFGLGGPYSSWPFSMPERERQPYSRAAAPSSGYPLRPFT